jgi:hypothetical protein
MKNRWQIFAFVLVVLYSVNLGFAGAVGNGYTATPTLVEADRGEGVVRANVALVGPADSTWNDTDVVILEGSGATIDDADNLTLVEVLPFEEAVDAEDSEEEPVATVNYETDFVYGEYKHIVLMFAKPNVTDVEDDNETVTETVNSTEPEVPEPDGYWVLDNGTLYVYWGNGTLYSEGPAAATGSDSDSNATAYSVSSAIIVLEQHFWFAPDTAESLYLAQANLEELNDVKWVLIGIGGLGVIGLISLAAYSGQRKQLVIL